MNLPLPLPWGKFIIYRKPYEFLLLSPNDDELYLFNGSYFEVSTTHVFLYDTFGEAAEALVMLPFDASIKHSRCQVCTGCIFRKAET